jgi:hypothetical protein
MASPKKSARSGQSLIEMMIALGMLTMAFLGIGALLSRSFFLNRVATDETIGSYLAAEGIEATKNIIDNDVYGTGLSWGLCCAVRDYSVTYQDGSLEPARPNSYLQFDSNMNDPDAGYQYTTGPVTPFKRMIKITVSNSSEIDVQSIVTWSTGPITNETIVDEDHFYDWHP